jgi:hypothetical protein
MLDISIKLRLTRTKYLVFCSPYQAKGNLEIKHSRVASDLRIYVAPMFTKLDSQNA